MPKCKNPNHPPQGSTIKVEPIRSIKDLVRIKNMLRDHPRNYAIFVIGINTNLRAVDLCRLTVGMVRGLKPMDEIEIKEKKTGKIRRITLNESCIKAIRRLLKSKKIMDEDQLFKGKRGPIVPTTIHALVKGWCRAINLRGNYGSHTLRKTWGYQQWKRFNASLPELMVCFNHSNQRQTLAYLCIQPSEIKKLYAHEI
ncbi:MAG TPA: integrase [bacterium]|nr:integrase [bacterium]